jgi:hypothetical protein
MSIKWLNKIEWPLVNFTKYLVNVHKIS